MSNVYISEPPASARVVFDTTHGPIEISLWCRECPLMTKMFLQLCLDGFYDGMIFHRIVTDFLIQTGAVRQHNKPAAFTKEYQKSIQAEMAMERRKYETHSRLRFSHRGQLAMALGVDDDDDDELHPQFFITLEEAPYLDGKHVLFGTVSGPTIFNAIRIGKMAPDDDHNQNPLDIDDDDDDDAPRIKSTRIVDNQIHTSLTASKIIPWAEQTKNETKLKKKKKRKGIKNINVLSFGDEMLQEDQQEQTARIKSSHDVVVSSQKSSNKVHQAVPQPSIKETNKAAIQQNDQGLLGGATNEDKQKHDHKNKDKHNLVRTVKDKTDDTTTVKPEAPAPNNSRPTFKSKATIAMEQEKSKASIIEPPLPKKEKPNKISAVEARRAKYAKKGAASKRMREDDTMAKLFAFKNKVQKSIGSSKSKDQPEDNSRDNSLAARMARRAESEHLPPAHDDNNRNDAIPAYHGQILEEDEMEERGDDWLRSKFKCRQHIDHSAGDGGDGRNMNDYEVIDEKFRNHGRKRDHRKR